MTKPAFRSSDYTFRPTSLAARLVEAGMIDATAMVREPSIEVFGRRKSDENNLMASELIHIKPTVHVPGSKSWIESRKTKIQKENEKIERMHAENRRAVG